MVLLSCWLFFYVLFTLSKYLAFLFILQFLYECEHILFTHIMTSSGKAKKMKFCQTSKVVKTSGSLVNIVRGHLKGIDNKLNTRVLKKRV